MYSSPKISIIIPVYNRYELLSYTLNSVLAQIFTDWECILVDDHSTDNSFQLLQEYQNKDVRFKVFKRPLYLKKGANACRNYGFLQARGIYIKWFDSDDIMLPNHLDIAYKGMLSGNYDFIFTDSVNFEHKTEVLLNAPFEFNKEGIVFSPENMAFQKIGWITNDFLGKKDLLKNLKFNENITDGDEYNFFIRFFHHTQKGFFLDEVVTHRRIHDNSISIINRHNNFDTIICNIKFQTANDLQQYNNKKLIRWFLSGYMRYAFQIANQKQKVPYRKDSFLLICRYFSVIKGCFFLCALFTGFYFKKGYGLMKMART
jgi:glycosyltransferase involved in cell wall biosynthesis